MSVPIHPLLELAETCVFTKQSQQPLYCIPLALHMYDFTIMRHPFFRSYGVILPSSLTRVLSSAFPYSGYLPVSDYGTITYLTHPTGFSWQCGIGQFARSVDWAPHPPRCNVSVTGTGLNGHIQPTDDLASCVPYWIDNAKQVVPEY